MSLLSRSSCAMNFLHLRQSLNPGFKGAQNGAQGAGTAVPNASAPAPAPPHGGNDPSQQPVMDGFGGMVDIGNLLDRIATEYIPVFKMIGMSCSHSQTLLKFNHVIIGIPTIHAAQEHSARNMTNLATVAALFSTVTANMLAFSWDRHNGPLSTAINTLWLISIIFSISVSVNSLLALTWTHAIL